MASNSIFDCIKAKAETGSVTLEKNRPDLCKQLKDRGSDECKAYELRFYFNSMTNECKYVIAKEYFLSSSTSKNLGISFSLDAVEIRTISKPWKNVSARVMLVWVIALTYYI